MNNEFEPRNVRLRAFNKAEGKMHDRVFKFPQDFAWDGLKYLGFSDNNNWIWTQDTGYIDKDGTAIFGGDILKIPGADPIIVQYREGGWDKHYLYHQAKLVGNVFET